MFEEYKKLLSWSEIKKLNSWEELEALSDSQQVYLAVLSTLKALGHWQVWIALGFLAICVYLGKIIGTFFGIQFLSLNLAGLFGAAVGGAVYSVVHIYEAKRSLRQVMQKNNKRERA